MPHSTAQLEKMALRRRPIGTGYYYNRRRISVIPRATMNDGADLEYLLNAADGAGYPIYNLDSPWYRGGGRPESPSAHLGGLLSRAVCPDDGYAYNEHGPIQTARDRAALPRHGIHTSPEWLAMMNVKRWRVHGTIGPFSFDEEFGAGQLVRYSPTWSPPLEDWVYEMTHRAAYGMGFDWFDSNGDGSARLVVALGAFITGGGDGPLDVLDMLNESPSPNQLLPRLEVRFSDSTPDPGGNQGAESAGFGFFNNGPGAEDGAVTFMGSPLMMRTTDGLEDPVGHSIAIEAAAWWGPDDPWFGE